MRTNARSLLGFAAVLAVLGLVIAGFSTKGFGLFADAPSTPQATDSAVAIDVTCPEWRLRPMPAALGRIEALPSAEDFHGATVVNCIAVGYDEADERIAMIELDVEAYGQFTPEQIAERARTSIEQQCGGPFQPDPDVPYSGSCASRTDTKHGVAAWAGLKDLIGVVVEIDYSDPARLKDLAESQSTTPDALLAATAAQVGQAVLAAL